MNRLVSSLAIAVAIAVPAIARAQATPDIQDAITADTQIDEALREQERTQVQFGEIADREIDGEAGVYVLALNEIFYVGGSSGGGWSENPVRTVDDVGDSFFASAAATFGVQTVLGGALDAGLAASVSGIEYDKAFGPSSRTVTLSANAGRAIGGTPFFVGVSAFGGRTYDNSFENGTGFYGGTAAISARVPLGPRTLLSGSLNGGRQMGEVEENNSWSAHLSADVTHFITPTLAIGASGRIGRAWFDDFYEDVTFVPRNDWQYGGNVNASWSPLPWLSVTGAVGREKRESAFFLSNYEGFEASLVLSARARF